MYGSASSSARWEETPNDWLTRKDVGFIQGRNEQYAFWHPERKLSLLTYCDNLLIRGKRRDVRWFFAVIGERFKIKDPQYLTQDSMLDHLGMTLFETDAGTHLFMQSYIELMVQKLEIDVLTGRNPDVPMSGDITDITPCNEAEKKLFMSGTGMIGWTSATGRPDLRVYHSRIARYMSDPVKGALEAMHCIVRYAWLTKDLCLFQSWGIDGTTWRFYLDSDQSSSKDAVAKAKSQLSYMGVLGTAPILFGSKSISVKFGEPDYDSLGAKHHGLHMPVCHPKMQELHADVSGAAAEIYAASVALNEILHLAYISDELGYEFPCPIPLEVDNASAIAFSKGMTKRSKLRHIDARQAWVEALRDQTIVELVKVDTKSNIADLDSKLLDQVTFERLRECIMFKHSLPELVLQEAV